VQGLRRSHEALRLAREQAHPFTLALTLVTIVILQHMRREGEPTLEYVQASVGLSTEYGFPYLTAIGTILQGWERTRLAQAEAGLTQMREGLATLRAMGGEVLRPSLLALLADAYARDGQMVAGLDVLEEALVTADEHTERFYAAELHRLQGEFFLQQWREVGAIPALRAIDQGHVADGGVINQPPLQIEAEACFQSALHIAQRQRAKMLELRATVSLSRLWQRQGKCTAAHALLAPIYGWFSEGFDTADLQEAKVLLEEIGG
jgi:predicted ATPase